MSETVTVGLDLAKNVIQVHGADGSGRPVLRKKLRRAQVLEFFGQFPSCVFAMEACGGAHFWTPGDSPAGSRGAADPARLREALREAAEERCRGCRGDARVRAGRTAIHRSGGSLEGDAPAPDHAGHAKGVLSARRR